MATLQPVLQTAATRSSAPATAAVMLDLDEPFLVGCRRRAAEFAADMRVPEQRLAWLVIGILTALLIYSYWPGLLNAQSSWNNPQYSHGWIVPLFAAGLLFWWRQPVQPVTLSARLAGIGLLVGSFALRLWCANYRIVTIDMYTFVPALAGVFLLAGGWQMFRWAWAPIAFLIFMYPLPDEATRYLLGPLQTLATIVSTYALQTLGYDAWRSGNIIDVGGHGLNVVDACAGLRMLTIFVALSVALVLVGGRDWWANAVVIAGAVPIALLVNAVRITTAGILHVHADKDFAEHFHDSTLAGGLMMVLALAMLFGLQQLLTSLVVAEDAAPAVVTAPRAGPAAGNPAVSPARKAPGFPALVRPGTAEKVS